MTENTETIEIDNALLDNIVKIKKTSILTGELEYVFVRIDELTHYSTTLDGMLYSGRVLSFQSHKTGNRRFVKESIIKVFGNISENELIEKYPEYLI